MSTTLRQTEVPIEVCEVIFDYIEEPSSLLSCAAVCKLWTATCRIRFLACSDHFLCVPQGKHWEFVDIITSPYNTFLPVLTKLQYEHNSLFPNIFPHLPPLSILKTLRLIGGDDKPILLHNGGSLSLECIHSQFNSLSSITHLEMTNIRLHLLNEVFDIAALFPNVSDFRLQSKRIFLISPIEMKEDQEPILTPITSLTVDCLWPAYASLKFFESSPYKLQLKELKWRGTRPVETAAALRKLVNHFSPWLENLTLNLPTADREGVNLRLCTRMTSVELVSTMSYTGYATTIHTLPGSIRRLKIVIEHPWPKALNVSNQQTFDSISLELANLVQRTPQLERIHIHIHFKYKRFFDQNVAERFEQKLRPRIPSRLLSLTTD